jgi:hypothetical protein
MDTAFLTCIACETLLAQNVILRDRDSLLLMHTQQNYRYWQKV